MRSQTVWYEDTGDAFSDLRSGMRRTQLWHDHMLRKYQQQADCLEVWQLRSATSAVIDLTELVATDQKALSGHSLFKEAARYQSAPSRPPLTA